MKNETECAEELRLTLQLLTEGKRVEAQSVIEKFRDCYLTSETCSRRGGECAVYDVIKSLELLIGETMSRPAHCSAEGEEPACTEFVQLALYHLNHGQPGIGLALLEPYRECSKHNKSCPFRGEDCAIEDVIKGLDAMKRK